MNLKKLILLSGLVLPLQSAFAQYAEDAFRFSSTENTAGTARIKALGGSQVSLGGDISSLSLNPAGLGLYTKSEVTFTPEFNGRGTATNYFGAESNIQTNKPGISQLGAVFRVPTSRRKGSDLTKGFLGFNLGLGYTKTNNFNTTLDYLGSNPNSSFVDYIADQAAGYSAPSALPSGSLADMGYNNFLIDHDAQGFFSAVAPSGIQENINFQRGSQSDFNIGFGSNYSNKFYFGGSLTISSLKYEADREFIESGKTAAYTGQDPNFTGGSYKLSYRSFQNTSGAGIGLKLGAIYRASDNIRLGASFSSPTWYTIDDGFSEVLDTHYTRANGTAISPDYTNDESIYDLRYQLSTPYKINGGITFTFGGMGLITGDVEYVDYSSIRFTADDDTQSQIGTRRDIRNTYKSAVNFKVGGEIKLNTISLRAGYNESGNPLQNASYSANIISGGIGYRKKNAFIDLTYSKSTTEYTARPYTISNSYQYFSGTGSGPSADVTDIRNNVYVTLGLRF